MSKPALTAEEWARKPNTMDFHPLFDQHKIAAVALYGQPFGFTRRDVEILRRCETILLDWEERDDEAEKHVQELADRIEALLPPS